MIVDDKVYGKQEISDPVALEIINTKEMQRLKGVGQYGTYSLLPEYKDSTSRFEHSLGVYFLLRILHAKREEQLAGLIHDINHSVFSHVNDYIHDKETTQTYGDELQDDLIRKSTIGKILTDNGMILDKKTMHLLDNELPDVCADRLDYCLRDGLVIGATGKAEIEQILASMHVVDGMIAFDKPSAEMLARMFLTLSSQFYACPFQAGSYRVLADALRIAMKEKIISEDDLMKTDDFVMGKLMKSGNHDILRRIASIMKRDIHEVISGGTFVQTKFRYIDPMYLEKGKLVRIMKSNAVLRKYKDGLQALITKGYHVNA